jgi:HPt (histidine-containing phosphotransfer) domain-containing protein
MDQPESKTTETPAKDTDPAAHDAAVAAKMRAVLAQIWKTNEPTLMERLAAIRTAEASLRAGTLDDADRAAARSAAHKLAGILGTFGLGRGTELSRQAELLLESDPPPGPEQAPVLTGILEELVALIQAKTQEVS